MKFLFLARTLVFHKINLNYKLPKFQSYLAQKRKIFFKLIQKNKNNLSKNYKKIVKNKQIFSINLKTNNTSKKKFQI